MPSRVVGWGGTVTVEGQALPIRNLTITRQAQEVDVTAHGDTKILSMAGRVKRGGSFEAYVGSNHGTVVTQIETPSPSNPATLVWSGEPSLSMEIVITSCEFMYAADDASVYSVSFAEALVIA